MFRGFAELGASGFDLAKASFQACFWTTTRHSLDFSKSNHNSGCNSCHKLSAGLGPTWLKIISKHLVCKGRAEGASFRRGYVAGGLIAKPKRNSSFQSREHTSHLIGRREVHQSLQTPSSLRFRAMNQNNLDLKETLDVSGPRRANFKVRSSFKVGACCSGSCPAVFWVSPRMEAACLQVSLCLSCSLCLLGSWGLWVFSIGPSSLWINGTRLSRHFVLVPVIKLDFFSFGFVFPPPSLSNQITVDQSALPREEGRGGRREGGRDGNCVVLLSGCPGLLRAQSGVTENR